jgi:TolB-like protein
VKDLSNVISLELKLLGAFEARDGAGRAVLVKARKGRALLAALALAPSQSRPRELLANLLWSDRGDMQARSSLRQALAGLRKDLATTKSHGSLLSISDVKVTIDPALAEIDALEFQRLALSNEVGDLRRAAALYRGELLADTYVRDPAFEEWVATERRHLSGIAAGVLEKLCAHETGPARIDAAKRLVALDPLKEASHRLLMQAYFEAGERGLALRQYEICRDTLRDELQVVPGEETETLRRDLLQSSVGLKKSGSRVDGAGVTARPEAMPMSEDIPTVAVLPFDMIGGDPGIESFCDGLTEDIITGLSRISAIRVVARSTMFVYKRRAVDIRSVGRDLGARYVLEGSVRASAKATRVAAQLIDAVGGHHIWAEQIDRPPGEVFELQDDITKSIVASVQTQVILNEGKLSATGNEPVRVPRLLARSWQRFLGLTEESLADARALAERALALDSKSGMGHRMLAIALYHQVYMGYVPWTDQVVDEMYTHANISIESEDADEYSHWAMECAHLLKMQHELAAASLRRALEINPNCSLAYGSMGTVLAWSGQYDASVESNELALRVNPQDPSNFFRHFGLALAHYLAGRHEKALSHARVVIQARPTWSLGQLIYAASLAETGRLDAASRTMNEFRSAHPEMGVSSFKVLPFANASDRKHLIDGLRSAGLEE